MTGIDQKLAHDYTNAVFVGLGGCGINTISRLRKAGIRGSKTVCISRFKEDLPIKGEDVVNFALLGKKADPARYLRSKSPVSLEERADAEKCLTEAFKGAKKVLLFAGLGGFTGTGIARVAAAAAKAEGAKLGMVITYPFKLEKKRRERADHVFPALQNLADDLVLRRNDDLVDLCPEKPMSEAFGMLDSELAEEIKKGAR